MMILQAFENRRHDRERRIFLVPAACLMALLLLIMAATAGAAEPAGRVIFSRGDITAVDADGVQRALVRDDVIYPGDTVRTAAQSMVDLRMRDDALISLDPESRFAVERYDLGDGTGSNAVMRFLRGALRTITGAIGKKEADTYQMHTPVATIGVRGTEYALQLCDAGCASEDRPAGLYGRVDEGAISVANEAASEVMTEGDYFYVADSDTAPTRLVRPPDGILGIAPANGDGIGALAATDDGLLDTSGSLLLDTTDTLLGTGGTLLQTGGGLLETGGDLLEAGGDLLEGTGDLLEQGGGLLEVGGGLLDTGGGLLDTGGALLDSGGGLLDDLGGDLGGSGDLLNDTDPGDEDGDLLDLLDLDGDGGLL